MKINGKTSRGPAMQTLVLPREDGDIVFKMQAVLDYKEFDALLPEQEPPTWTKSDGTKEVDFKNKKYLAYNEVRWERRIEWMLLKSLEATPGLEWSTVDMSDPDTWSNYEQDMVDYGITEYERLKIQGCVTEVNGLNDAKIIEATKSFLAGQADKPEA